MQGHDGAFVEATGFFRLGTCPTIEAGFAGRGLICEARVGLDAIFASVRARRQINFLHAIIVAAADLRAVGDLLDLIYRIFVTAARSEERRSANRR